MGSTSSTIDAAGGTLSYQGLSLALPAAAVSTSTAVGLQQETVNPPALARFRFSPAGQPLAVPAELRYSAAGLPANARFFWEVAGEMWLLPGQVSGGVLSSQVSSLGYNGTGTLTQPAALSGLARAAAWVRPLAGGDSGGGAVVVQPVDCDVHITELKLRLARAASDGDPNRALGIQQDLKATREACSAVRAAELQQASCDALARAQANAPVQIASDLSEFRRLTVPLLTAQALVETSGANCSNADPASNPALIQAKFDQLLDIMKGQMTRAEFDDTLTVRDLGVVMHLDALCQQLGLEAICTRLSSELYPDLLDALRASAFNDCRANGTPLSVSQFYALGSRAGDTDHFFFHGRFSLAAVEADLSYCSNPALGLRVFDGDAVPNELTDRATTVTPLVALGNYQQQQEIEVPRDGSLNISGTVPVLRCPDGSASAADLVFRLNGQEWVRRTASGDAYRLDSAPLLLDLPKVAPGFGIDLDKGTGFSLTLNREGGGCSDGSSVVLGTPFEMLEVKVTLPEVAPKVLRLSAGSRHNCALTKAGALKCWGDNRLGQIGDGSTMARLAPVTVTGLDSGVADVSAGYVHTCALTSAGAVKCWGSNTYGQLGSDVFSDLGGGAVGSKVPVTVTGLGSGVVAISAGSYHTCALTSAGAVKCWGYNNTGQLGDGSPNVNQTTPVDVVGLSSGVKAISSGGRQTCALTRVGSVKCWGYLFDAQLDSSKFVVRATPLDVVGLSSGVTAISNGGDTTCAITSGGALKCWGYNGQGQLGDGTDTDRARPVDVVGLGSGVASVSNDSLITCALTTVGAVKCWGHNGLGQLGNGTTINSATPVGVIGLSSGVKAISTGGYSACARTSGDAIKCWGAGTISPLGDGTASDSLSPVDVIGFP